MTAFTLNFHADGAAFEEGGNYELQRMLQQVATKVGDDRTFGHVVDTNGAVVGSFDFTLDMPDDETRQEDYQRKERLDEKIRDYLESLGLSVDTYVLTDAISVLAEFLVMERGNREWTP